MKNASTLSVSVFAVGMALTTATQLRAAAGVGPGEILLVVWTAAGIATLPWRRDFEATPLFAALAMFWAVAAYALASGFLLAPADLAGAGWSHDAAAFGFLIALLLTFLASSTLVSRCVRTLPLVLAGIIGPLSALWLAGLVVPILGPLELWYYDRFVGWSANPNQVALAVTAAPFCCLYVSRTRSGLARLGWWLLAGMAGWLGIQSGSDAVQVAWGVAGLMLLLFAWARLSVRGMRHVPSAIAAYGVAPVLAVALVLGAAYQGGTHVVTVAREIYEKGDQGTDRLWAWKGGITVLAASPLVGRGPGAHAPGYLTSENLEAHNTFIDWGASTGLVGLAAYITLLLWLLSLVWRARDPMLLGAIVALTSFSLFGYVLRQPIYWYFLVCVAALASPPPTASARKLRF